MSQIYHPSVATVVPWNANYTFPSQATSFQKQTVKLQPETSTSASPGSIVRIELPPDGYLNGMNSVLRFDLSVAPTTTAHVLGTLVLTGSAAQPVFTLASTTASYNTEDFYNNWWITYIYRGQRFVGRITDQADTGVLTVVPQDGFDFPIGQELLTNNYDNHLGYALIPCVLMKYPTALQRGGGHQVIKRLRILYSGIVLEDIQEYAALSRLLQDKASDIDYHHASGALLDGNAGRTSHDAFITGSSTELLRQMSDIPLNWGTSSGLNKRTVCLSLMSGLLTCKKLIPLKYMSGQLTIELTLATAAEALLSMDTAATFSLENISYLGEMMMFDTTYDAAFMAGMDSDSGVPIKFNSWAYHTKTLSGANEHILIPEKRRSIKTALAYIGDQTKTLSYDSHIAYFDAGAQAQSNSILPDVPMAPKTSYARPIESYQWRIGNIYYPAQPVECGNGGAEAYVELAKALNTLGDYQVASLCDTSSWTTAYDPWGGRQFVMAAEFENTDVFPETVAGINTELMSDIMLNLKLANGSPPSGKQVNIFLAYEALIILRVGGRVELIV